MKSEIDPGTRSRIRKFGKVYKPALLPSDLQRGRVGHCFDDSIVQLTDDRLREKYGYVEGIAKATPNEPWVLHAWLTDGVHAFDPTWYAFGLMKEPRVMLAEYIGIEMPPMEVMLFMSQTEYQGIIGNGWRNCELASLCLPEGFRITKTVQNRSRKAAGTR